MTFDYDVDQDGMLCFKGRYYVPDNAELRQAILCEAHSSTYAIHPVKTEHQHPSRLLQPIKIPELKWERITMNFITGLPMNPSKKDSVVYLRDRQIAWISLSIISDRDLRFTSIFWKALHMGLSTRLDFSTAFHLQTDGQLESVIHVLEDMLWGYVIDFMTELHDKRTLGPALGHETEDTVRLIHDRLNEAFDKQKSYADQRRKYIQFEVGDQLELPLQLSRIHDVFHVSMLRLYRPDPLTSFGGRMLS
ncbi:uncharacterized protein LOC120132499 [Hibiscus syriacus]|uniref:uncharacterized protein LOC120132499 n=1 Tax=Hibiscus syriacus TaxID=106335 RepID=UPI001920BD31|nr:uncharacterized protein LOC120132499 [Hibiscus syriacus]